MGKIRFSLAQIEAFASVCESGNLTRAAKRLGKDRTTVGELVEYLELDLGYALFDRHTRPLRLTDAGQRLYRQARLFLQEAETFCQLAEHIPQQVRQRVVLCYDAFTPRRFLSALSAVLYQQGIALDLRMMERAEAEDLLADGAAHLGVYQALNRSISDRFKWRALGALEMAVYAREGFFPDACPIPLIALAAHTQLLPFSDLPDAMAKRLQISDRIRVINELPLLQAALSAGQGWAFLPTHFQAQQWPAVSRLDTELGQSGLTHPMVALWKPGADDELLRLIEQMQRIYREES